MDFILCAIMVSLKISHFGALKQTNKQTNSSVKQDTNFGVAIKPKNITVTLQVHCFVALNRNWHYHSYCQLLQPQRLSPILSTE